MLLTIYYDISLRYSYDIKSIFNNNAFQNFIIDFINRPAEDKSIECMGWVMDNNEFGNPIYYRSGE